MNVQSLDTTSIRPIMKNLNLTVEYLVHTAGTGYDTIRTRQACFGSKRIIWKEQ